MKLSVHILTFNNEKHISCCLNSVIDQKTTFPFEIVIGDDASLDKTSEIIKTYVAKNKNIHLKTHAK
ncbi:MAG: glycosyltransferase, partial [Flavobacteriaceae bacterium]|nr:glycosyltransferase [Flavobacteriaceae bacterium]